MEQKAKCFLPPSFHAVVVCTLLFSWVVVRRMWRLGACFLPIQHSKDTMRELDARKVRGLLLDVDGTYVGKGWALVGCGWRQNGNSVLTRSVFVQFV